MALRWPFGRTYTVRCPDGTSKEVYRDIDSAVPLYIPGSERSLSAAASVIGSGSAELKGAHASKIQGLLFGLDELTQTVMINFRNVYLVYQSDPCKNARFLAREVEKLVSEQQRLSRLRIQMKVLLELTKNRPDDTIAILTLFKELAGDIGGVSVATAASLEIVEARQLADKWSGE